MATLSEATLALNSATCCGVEVVHGEELGIPSPRINCAFVLPHSIRVVSAFLHRLVAEVELCTPEDERWLPHVDLWYERVYLELNTGTQEEAERGLVTLRAATRAMFADEPPAMPDECRS